MADGRVTRRRQLTIHADLLAQAPGDPRFGVGERHLLGANATVPTAHPPLAIDQRHGMPGPRQVIPRPIPRRSHTAGAMSTPATRISRRPLPLDADMDPPGRRGPVPDQLHDAESGQAQDPRTISLRSQASSLAAQQERTTPGRPVPSGIALPSSRPPSRPPIPSAAAQAAGYHLRSPYSNRRTARIRTLPDSSDKTMDRAVSSTSPVEVKIALFRSLFPSAGRRLLRRFESRKSARSRIQGQKAIASCGDAADGASRVLKVTRVLCWRRVRG